MELRIKKLKELFLFPAVAVMIGCFCYQSAVGIKTAAAETKQRTLISAQTTSFDQNETLQNAIQAEEQRGGVSALSLNTDTSGFLASRDYGGVFLVDGILHINVVENEHYESNAGYFSQMFYGEQEVIICPVEHTLERLEQLNDLLSDHWDELSIKKMALMEKENYVEVFLENPDDDEDITDFIVQNGYPLSAVKISQYQGAIRLESSNSLYGGDLISLYGKSLAEGEEKADYHVKGGSIGAFAADRNGKLGLVTAAHVAIVDGYEINPTKIYYSSYAYSQYPYGYIGETVAEYLKPFYNYPLDATFIPIDNPNWSISYQCHYKNGSSEAYATLDDKITATENTSKLIVGATVVKYGETTFCTTGVITSLNEQEGGKDPASGAALVYPFKNLIEADYYSESGDSGGSVFVQTYNNATRTYTNYLVSIHKASNSEDQYISYSTKISDIEKVLGITIITKKNYSQYV